eukprot:TRINITY_DN14574_c0_g1_i1.p1 TRINITY_DN14574_c0_g1~~TRINITY_DN14574_c0_g1_i1.p1  ORF type:complete len:601 (+),score=165.02 TRINITY_DN14574_c0_g1_i1:63-1865(+)
MCIRDRSQPCLGVFSIRVGDIIKQTEKDMQEKIEHYKRISEFLTRNPSDKHKAYEKFGQRSRESSNEPRRMKTTVDELKKMSENFVIEPVYDRQAMQKRKRLVEKNKPDRGEYMDVGYNTVRRMGKKHYRRIFHEALEETELMDRSPFEEVSITRGKKIKATSTWHYLLGEPGGNFTEAGKMKAKFRIMNESLHKSYQAASGKLKEYIEESKKYKKDKKGNMFATTNVTVRVYIIDALGLVSKDASTNANEAQSDPYIVVKLGDFVFNDQSNFQDNVSNPRFCKRIDIKTTLPGNSQLEIEVWDHDLLVSDDLIGSTTIDLENRFFSKRWQALKYKPIETRKLYHPSSDMEQGRIRLWVEIIPQDDAVALKDIWDITDKPPSPFEIRVVVWEVDEIPESGNDDDGSGDFYVSASLENGHSQSTDVHYRNEMGRGSYNWRMIFPVLLPLENGRDSIMTFMIKEKDFFEADDCIGEFALDFTEEANTAFENDISVTKYNTDLLGKREDQFWRICKRNGKDAGRIKMSFQILNEKDAKERPAGLGQSEPNQHPYLPPSAGRLAMTWNIVKMVQGSMGKKAKFWIIVGGAVFLGGPFVLRIIGY